jgi:peptide deformylase
MKILTYPNPILDKEAEDVKFPLDGATKNLIKDMWKVVEGKGVGLAAPQVGVSKKLCIVHLTDDIRGKKSTQKDFIIINPKIVFSSVLEAQMIEGCLSFPDQYYEIWRPANIILEYFDEKGKKHTLRAKDWLARIILHEVDHLYGKLFINMDGRKLTEKELAHKTVVD